MRILIELPTWLGDAVMASAAVEVIAKHAGAFDAGNLTSEFEGLADTFTDGFDFHSASGDETARKFDKENLTVGDDAGAFGDDISGRNFSFLSQNFGATTQEIQIFTNKNSLNSDSEFNAKFEAGGDANLTAKTQNLTLNGQNLKPSETAQISTAFGKTATNSEQKFENLSQDFKAQTQKLENQAQNFKKKDRLTAQNRENLADKHVKIVFFGSFAACELFKAHPNCERVIVDSSKKAKFRLWQLFWQARNLGKFDAAFSFRSSFASKILLFGARARQKFIFQKSKDGAHQVQKYLKFVKAALNLKRADDELKLYFEPRKFDAPVLGLNPGASYGSAKRWYPAYFAQAALHFKDEFKIMIFGGAGERDMCERIERILRENGAECENLAGKTSVRELCENIGGIQQSGGIFVTNDSGPMHIAAAYKTPTITLFGPTRFTQTCPWRNENARILHLNLACMPCMKRVCPLKTHACMKDLSPQAVIQTIEREFLAEAVKN